MLLSNNDVKQFYKLNAVLMSFVNQRLGLVPIDLSLEEFHAIMPPEVRVELRDAVANDRSWIDKFLAEPPESLRAEELEMIDSWRHQIPGTFYIFRQLKRDAIFLLSGGEPTAYGVVGLSQPLPDLVGGRLPAMVKTVLLPFNDKIIYDGLLAGNNISFGGGVKRMLNDTYREAKAGSGVVKSLPTTRDDGSTQQPSVKPNKRIVKKRVYKQMGKKTEKIYRFKITLKHSKPSIWRRIETTDVALEQFHEQIQTAMGWTNSHLHQFKIDGERFTDSRFLIDSFEDFGAMDYSDIKLGSIFTATGGPKRIVYEYDFGDCWIHDVVLEAMADADPNHDYPRCVAGRRACPPEDVGGVWGFSDYVDAITDPSHDQHADFMEWNGPFDPVDFDPIEATVCMKQGLPS